MEPELKTEVFPGELVNPSDPRNNFEIEKQRRSELSLINDVPNFDEQIAKLKEIINYLYQ